MAHYVEYERWNGVGNLLNIIDNRNGRYNKFFSSQDAKRRLCTDTHADGIMELRSPPEGSEEQYHVVYHSGLGICGTIPLCGNGSRCTVAYACTHDIVPELLHQQFTFLAGDGVHDASYTRNAGNDQHYVTISMRDIEEVVKVTDEEYFANCGTAHLVKFVPVDTCNTLDIKSEGWRLARERADLAPRLTVLSNFTEDHGEDVYCRCFNPDLDAEILACGTGSTSIAVCHASFKGEEDGTRKKDVRWKNGAIIVGYTKMGNKYVNLSLESRVFCEVKGQFEYE